MPGQILKANQHSGGQSSERSGFKRLRQRNLRNNLPRDNAAEVRVTNPNRLGYSGLSQPNGSEPCLESNHPRQFAAALQKVNSEATLLLALHGQNGSMSEWPYREAFDKHYREYRARTGASLAEVAAALGKHPGTVNSYRRQKEAITPPPEVLVKAAQLFNCDVTEFMPDYKMLAEARAEVAGLSEVDIYRISEATRILNDGTFTQEEKDLLIQAIRERRDLLNTVKRTQRRD